MEDDNSLIKTVPSDQKRRSFFKAALAASVVPAASTARVNTVKNPVSWVHGNSATIVGVHDLEMDIIRGNARVVRGRSWSTIPLHFAIPLFSLDMSSPIYVNAIWVRLQADTGAKIASLAVHDCETTLAHIDGISLQPHEWDDVRIQLQTPQNIIRSIGVTLNCEFSDVSRQIGISAVGCEFKLSS